MNDGLFTCDSCGETMDTHSDMYETHNRWCAAITIKNRKYGNLMHDRYGKPEYDDEGDK